MTTAAVARQHISETYPELCDRIDSCADAVVDRWDGTCVADRSAVVGPFEQCLDRTGLRDRLLTVLVSTVEAIGHCLSAPPVAAPPYLTITSRGPVLRASFDNERLIVRFDAFALTTTNGYARGERGTDMLTVRLLPSP
ncbi:MAG: hypothetical protein ABEH65_06935 [Halobacteriales archaeon]